MQVTSAIGFSISPAQNAEITEGAANATVSLECGCSTGESLFTRLFFSAIAKEGSGKLQELIPEITNGSDASEDQEAGVCDISAVIAQLFISPKVQENGTEDGQQNTDLSALSAVETEDTALPQAQELNIIIKSETANSSEAGSDIPKTEVSKDKTDFGRLLNAEDAHSAENPVNTNAEIIRTDVTDTEVIKTTSGTDPKIREPKVNLNVGVKETAEMLTAKKTTDTPAASETAEKLSGGDITDFVGKIKEAVKNMGGKEAESGTSEGFTAEKKETASVKDSENATPIHITPPNTELEEIEKSASVEKALSRLTEDLKSVERGVSEIKIVLEPESLGTLTISVSKTENGITASIKSDDKEICGIISGQIQKLVDAMEKSGIKIEDVDVSYGGSTGQDLSFTQNSSGGNQSWNSPQHRYTSQIKADTAENAGAFSKWQDYQSADDGVSSMIEYRI